MQGQRSPVRTFPKNLLSVNGSNSSGDPMDYPMSWDGLQSSSSVSGPLTDYQLPRNEAGNRNAEWCFGESSSSAAQRSENRARAYPQDLNVMSAEYKDEEEEEEEAEDEVPNRGSSSSDSLELLSGYHRFVMDGREEADPVFSLDAPRMPYKRKATEVRRGGGGGGQSSGGSGASDFLERAETSRHRIPQVAASNEINLSLASEDGQGNSRVRVEAVSTNPSLLTPSELPESSIRNLHPRSSSPFWMQEASSLQHYSGLPLRDYLFSLAPAPGLGNGTYRGQSLSQYHPPPTTTPLLGNQPARWTGLSSRRTTSGSSSASEIPSRNGIPRSISEHPVFLPGDDIRNPPQQRPAATTNSSNPSVDGNVGSRVGSSSSLRRYPSSSLSLRSGSRHHQRLSEMMRRSLMPSARVLGNNHPMQPQSSAAGTTTLQDNHRRRLMGSRHLVDGGFEVPHSLRALAAASAQGRRHTMTEIRHVLELMRRGESLRFEDMMILDHSILFGMAEMHDRHRDMRMDVDNMSYEELLALEERIGNVCTGLSEDAIANNLKRWKYRLIIGIDDDDDDDEMEKAEPCCICREEYVAGEDVGKLNCGHDFHTHCIKKWLMQKNLCPICKTTGLNI